MMTKEREYRSLELRADTNDPGDYLVRGYASTWDKYMLWECDGIEYYEEIDRNAFEEADLSDVVFRVDHTGRVYARTSADTVKLSTDDTGLAITADLSKTTASRSLYEDIAAGNYPKMSFAFTVKEDKYNSETRTRTILKIDKVFDVSPVSFPANPNTEISARDYFNGVIEGAEAERLERIRISNMELQNEIKRNMIIAKLEGSLNE